MPQMLAAALIGAGLYAGYRWLRIAVEHVSAELDRVERDLERRAGTDASSGSLPKDLGRLEYDAAAGVYRPVGR